VAAFNIVSETYRTRTPLKLLFDFLGDFKNFETILPVDKVSGFEFSGDSCSFNIQGITKLSVSFVEKIPYEYLVFRSAGLASFNFILKVHFIGVPGNAGECRIELSGDMNPFIRSMAEKPLTGLVNAMSLRLSQLELPHSINQP
jgi:hypothetical protein